MSHIQREVASRHGFRRESCRGQIVLEQGFGARRYIKTPFELMLAAILSRVDYLLLEAHNFGLRGIPGYDFSGEVNRSALVYQNGFWNYGSWESGILVCAPENLQLFGTVLGMNPTDTWCMFKLREGGNRERFVEHFRCIGPSTPDTQESNWERRWLQLAFMDCECIIAPAGDGRYVDFWTVTSSIPDWAEEAITLADSALDKIESELGNLTLSESENVNVLNLNT